MPLLIILNRFVIGGQAVDTFPLAHLLKEDFDILIVYGEKEPDELDANFLLEQYPGLKLKKVQYLRRSLNPLVDVAAFFQILFIIFHFKPAIVHTHGAKSGLLGRMAAFVARVPVIVHTFHGHLFHSYFSRRITRLIIFLERCLAKITTGFIALSTSQYNDLVNVFKVLPAQKIRIIPLGFIRNYGNSINLRSNFRIRYGLSEGDVAIGIVGRIVPVKNHLFFVEVVNRLLKMNAGTPSAFFIIGDGELRSELETRFKQLDVSCSTTAVSQQTRVVFTSWLTNISEVMSGLDIVVLTSLNEGTPLSMIEAQAFAKPVVATNVGGVKDTIRNGETGFYVDKDDVQGFTDKLLLLINNAGKRAMMGSAGQRFVNEHFSKQNEVARTKEFYFSLLKGQGILFGVKGSNGV